LIVREIFPAQIQELLASWLFDDDEVVPDDLLEII
jgi:hypothetical protein